jgi:aminopeptidase-like protein
MRSYDDEIDMMELLGRLAPLARTLACRDTDRALDIVAECVPGAKIEGFPSGTRAWSWTVPQRWELDRAHVRAGGETLVSADWHPLHVVNYSQPFSGRVGRDELLAHLHTNPARPDAIPFTFSFYEKRWGFSVPHAWLPRFHHASYEVEIAARFEEGPLNVLSSLLEGDTPGLFILCADVCHPAQVNDSLTGLAAAVDIFRRLERQKRRKYSYLLLVVPETIGTIAFLARHPEIVSRSVAALFSEMLGTGGPLVGQRTRRGDTYWDRLLEAVLAESGVEQRTVPFLKSAGNDEKVFDSPGVDIPALSVTRYPYPEYHTSDDNLSLIQPRQLREARDLLQALVDTAERDYVPRLSQPGPVFLSGHGLYPDWRGNPALLPAWKAFLDVMYGIDNRSSVIELAARIGVDPEQVFYWADGFCEKGLATRQPFVQGRIPA